MVRDEAITNAFLASLLSDINDLQKNLDRVIGDLSDNELNAQPTERAWSILGCLGHINQTNELYLPRLREAHARAPAVSHGEPLPYRPSWMGRQFLSFLVPESRRKFLAPRKFRPATTPGRHTAYEDFHRTLRELANLIRESEGKDFNAVRFPSPVTRLVRFTLADGFAVVVTHTRRHMRQIERTRHLIAES